MKATEKSFFLALVQETYEFVYSLVLCFCNWIGWTLIKRGTVECKLWQECNKRGESHDIQKIKYILSSGNINLNYVHTSGSNLLHVASQGGNKETVELLLAKGANIDSQHVHNGWTSLHYASFLGFNDLIQLLLDKGADINMKCVTSKSALHIASYQGNTEVVQLLLDNGLSLNEQDSLGKTALHEACSSGKLETIKFLLFNGGDYRIQDQNGKTPLDVLHDNLRSEVDSVIDYISIR